MLGRSSTKTTRSGALARDDRRLDELAVAQRERLRAEDARAPGPARERRARRRCSPGPGGRYAASTIASGRPGITRKTLMSTDSTASARPPRKPAVMPMSAPTSVTKSPTVKPDGQRDARARDGLREHVLPLPRRAEQVAPRGRQVRHGDERRRIADDGRADERHDGEGRDDGRAEGGLAVREQPAQRARSSVTRAPSGRARCRAGRRGSSPPAPRT